MRTEDLKVGHTYLGRRGKPRTIVAFGRSHKGEWTDRKDAFASAIRYHRGNSAQVFECWFSTFLEWANPKGLP